MAVTLRKVATGIPGLDEITGGGLPRGRPTLVCGGPGCGKTLLALEFVARAALEQDEPGVIVSFEERIEDLDANGLSIGIDLRDLRDRRLLAADYVRVQRREFEESGEYDLEGLFVRLAFAVQSVGATRVVLDTVDTLFAGIPDEAIVRAELKRLFDWLKERELTTIVTAERGVRSLTRHGVEEYVSDCVIVLDHRVQDELSTRRLRIMKYRGSSHGTNEYPFLIGESGMSVLPITSLALEHAASSERESTGIPGLDEMLGGEGYFKGSSVLVTGGPGTGKTCLAASFVDAACRRGQRCMYVSFEESPDELTRNLHSIGLDFGRWLERGLLRCQSVRPSRGGLETHLLHMHRLLEEFQPDVLVVDPLSALYHAGRRASVEGTMLRIVDVVKHRGITGLYLSLSSPSAGSISTFDLGVSSIMDTWIDVSNSSGRRNMEVVKARGSAITSRPRELSITDRGLIVGDTGSRAAEKAT